MTRPVFEVDQAEDQDHCRFRIKGDQEWSDWMTSKEAHFLIVGNAGFKDHTIEFIGTTMTLNYKVSIEPNPSGTRVVIALEESPTIH